MTTCLPGCLSTRGLRAKFDQILPHFDERGRRLYLAGEATAIGHGGIARVAAASGTSTATVARGIAELAGCSVPTRRVRAPGAGRKRLTDTDAGPLPTLESLIEPHTRGDPVSPLRWTTLSLRALATTLTAQGHPVRVGVKEEATGNRRGIRTAGVTGSPVDTSAMSLAVGWGDGHR
jgi:hypothetical protein